MPGCAREQPGNPPRRVVDLPVILSGRFRVVAIVDLPVSPDKSILADTRGGRMSITDATGMCTLSWLSRTLDTAGEVVSGRKSHTNSAPDPPTFAFRTSPDRTSPAVSDCGSPPSSGEVRPQKSRCPLADRKQRSR